MVLLGMHEEYIDYLFPEESQASSLKILEQAYKWKKQKVVSDDDDDDDDIVVNSGYSDRYSVLCSEATKCRYLGHSDQ
ncbi:hypothetical protein HanPI659440_Chr01g0029761 [Helianthus annuus]|nr:hypothetical protein HanPI659440_Chr01g0029761 [Helianthus annuus]